MVALIVLGMYGVRHGRTHSEPPASEGLDEVEAILRGHSAKHRREPWMGEREVKAGPHGD